MRQCTNPLLVVNDIASYSGKLKRVDWMLDGRNENRLRDLADRCTFIGGDMFDSVPAADIYFMKLILHDWNDNECVQILENIHGASGDDVSVFIVEHLITDPATPHFSKLFDIHMMGHGSRAFCRRVCAAS